MNTPPSRCRCPCCERTRRIVKQHVARVRADGKLARAYDLNTSTQERLTAQLTALTRLQEALEEGEQGESS